jgi:UV DNA damage endonuclease
MIRLGLVCINNSLHPCPCSSVEDLVSDVEEFKQTNKRKRKLSVFCSRGLRQDTFTVKKAQVLALQNIADIRTLLRWNQKNGINVFRISSDLLPRYVDTSVDNYSMEFAHQELQKTGKLIKQLGHRIIMHPDQFVNLASPNETVVVSSIAILKMHADLMDLMDIDSNGVMIIHGGGLYESVYSSKEVAMEKWIERFNLLPSNVKRRLVIENCEMRYNVEDCLIIAKACKIPVVFDTHHHWCYTQKFPNFKFRPINEILLDVASTWKANNNVNEDRRLLMHVSSPIKGRNDIRAHADYIDEIPQYLFDFVQSNNINVDLEVEAKAKELAIFDLRKKYPQLQ